MLITFSSGWSSRVWLRAHFCATVAGEELLDRVSSQPQSSAGGIGVRECRAETQAVRKCCFHSWHPWWKTALQTWINFVETCVGQFTRAHRAGVSSCAKLCSCISSRQCYWYTVDNVVGQLVSVIRTILTRNFAVTRYLLVDDDVPLADCVMK